MIRKVEGRLEEYVEIRAPRGNPVAKVRLTQRIRDCVWEATSHSRTVGPVSLDQSTDEPFSSIRKPNVGTR